MGEGAEDMDFKGVVLGNRGKGCKGGKANLITQSYCILLKININTLLVYEK